VLFQKKMLITRRPLAQERAIGRNVSLSLIIEKNACAAIEFGKTLRCCLACARLHQIAKIRRE
jgi:hypothetical protein